MRLYRFFFAVVLTWTLPVLADEATPTFSRDVAKIIYEKCTVCHRPDSSGPFSLLTYDDVRRRAKTIVAVVDDSYMPPWKPVDHGIEFANNRSLSIQQMLAIKSWVDAGCPEGERETMPTPPNFGSGWTLGEPDMIVKMNGTFDVPADGPDIYRSFVLPLDLAEDKWVKAVELRPRAKSSVHHAIFFLDSTGNARKLDGLDGKTGISGMGFLAGLGTDINVDQSGRAVALLRSFRESRSVGADDLPAFRANEAIASGLGGYVPGATPNSLPGDLAMALPRGSDIVMQTHFHPSGKAETEQAEIALYFADRPPSRQLIPVMVPAMFGFGAGIQIPPGETDYRITDSLTLPVDTQAVGVSGHAHYVCREMKLTAQLPKGQTRVLLHIDDWDLDWQDQYLFAEPIDLPAGTVLRTEIVYDNSVDNPENPHHPPREIRWGRGSTDEMGSVTLMTVASRKADEPQLQGAVRRHFIASLVDRENSELSQMLMQLDDNDDGKLQRKEAPPRFNSELFQFVDQDGDGALDKSEVERALGLRKWLRR